MNEKNDIIPPTEKTQSFLSALTIAFMCVNAAMWLFFAWREAGNGNPVAGLQLAAIGGAICVLEYFRWKRFDRI